MHISSPFIQCSYAPWFERLLNDGTLTEQYFSIYLVRASDVTSQPEGSLPGAQLCIGCVDSSKYTGEMCVRELSAIPLWCRWSYPR